MKKIMLVASILFSSIVSFSQIGAGINFGYTKYPDSESSFLTYGVHGMLGAVKDSKWDARLMFSTGAEKSDNTYSAVALSSLTTPQYIDVNVETKFRYSIISLDAIRNFGEGSMEDGGFYAGIGLGLGIGSFSYTIEDYSNNYSLGFGSESESASQIYLRGLLGYSFVMDNGLGIFAEGFLNLPPNSNGDGEAIEISLYGSLGLNAGIRKTF